MTRYATACALVRFKVSTVQQRFLSEIGSFLLIPWQETPHLGISKELA